MILETRTVIDAPPSRVFACFEDMEALYVRWHPDHRVFRWIKGRGCKEGNVFYFNETIAGRKYPKKVVFTEVRPGAYIAFAPVWCIVRLVLPRMSFEMRDQGGKTELIALRMGPLTIRMHRREFEIIRRHMQEEGENLKRIVEAAKT